MKWFSEKSLFPEEKDEGQEDWMITDLRKIVLYLTCSVVNKTEESTQVSKLLLRKCVDKFGHDRIKEFFEIQLMH